MQSIVEAVRNGSYIIHETSAKFFEAKSLHNKYITNALHGKIETVMTGVRYFMMPTGKQIGCQSLVPKLVCHLLSAKLT